MINERCEQTIDLEECIIMNEREFNHIKATVIYDSGRIEEFEANLLKSGLAPKWFSKRVVQSRSFPTVENVKVSKF